MQDVQSKVLYKCIVKVLNKATLKDTVWREKLGLDDEVKVKVQRIKSQLLDFLIGKAKLDVYISRKIEGREGQRGNSV